MTIGEGTIDGVAVRTLSSADGELEAAFAPGAGMICCSLRHRGEQVLGLRGGLRSYVEQRSTMGIPLLYPWANRLAASRFTLAGREVDVGAAQPPPKADENGLPIHGLLAAADGWRIERHEATASGAVLAARFDLAADSPLAAGFPFPHRLELEAELADATLTVRTSVRADAGSPVPVAFGFHPYLALPGAPRAEWRLEAPLPVRLRLDERGIPTGEREPAGPLDGPLADRTFDDAFLAPRPGDAFALSGGGRRIEVRFDDAYPFAQLYAPPGQELLAYEPMTAPTNALVSGEGLRVLEPGERFDASFEITIAPA